MSDIERCNNCRFWKRDGFGRALGGPNTDGTVSPCVRHSPLSMNSQRYPHDTAVWPTTNINDYCGEWVFDGLVDGDYGRRVESEKGPWE